MLQVSGSTSTKTGVAPSSTIISAVATKVKGVVITSSPGFDAERHQAISSASVPRGDGDAVVGAGIGGEPLLQLGDLRAHDVLAVVEHRLDARVDGSRERRILRLQVDEFDLFAS